MPWSSQKQVGFLLSSGSPLNATQKEKMKGELHQLGPENYLKKPTVKKDHPDRPGRYRSRLAG